MGYDYGGRVALVTGASSGIGRQVALDLAARGTRVVAAARRVDRLEELGSGSDLIEPLALDVGERDAVEGAVRGVIERHGRLDLLVNNAGMPMRVHATRLTSDQVEEVMRVNFFGAVWATLTALPHMLERRDGRIVNVASVAGRLGSPRESAYTASKFALTGWSEVTAADLHGTGVRVHLIVPGPIATEIWDLGQEPHIFKGRRYPPSIVSRAIRRSLEDGRFERWAPRSGRFVGVFHDVARGAFVKGIARFDKRAPS